MVCPPRRAAGGRGPNTPGYLVITTRSLLRSLIANIMVVAMTAAVAEPNGQRAQRVTVPSPLRINN